MAEETSERAEPLQRLRTLLDEAGRKGPARLSAENLYELPRLYRHGASRIALLETTARDPGELAATRELVARAHALLYRELEKDTRGWIVRTAAFLFEESPATIRREWRLLAVSFALIYGLATVAFLAVRSDLELAFALLSPEMVTREIHQLEQTAAGEPFRGNFTFGIGESPMTSGWIMAHNIGIGVLFFALGLIPPLFLMVLAVNGLMLGTYTAVASHWDQGWEISSILWCHGVLEIQAIVLAGAAGLVLVRAWIAPGPWSRRHAMSLESARAWRLLAPVFPMLFLAGLIEGFISPHAPLEVRVATAVTSGIALVFWVGFGGRSARAVTASTTADPSTPTEPRVR